MSAAPNAQPHDDDEPIAPPCEYAQLTDEQIDALRVLLFGPDTH